MPLYHRFPLSLRDVEEMMAERAVSVSYDTIHQWCVANSGRPRQRTAPPPVSTSDKWHLDEVLIKIGRKTHYLWRAVDQHGQVVDVLVSEQRDLAATRQFFTRALQPGND